MTDAVFETMSGFTTTGATILVDIEAAPHGILFWRSMIQWIGGMGIIVLSLAILPMLGVGGMQLFRAEAPGPSPDKLTPRIRQTAAYLWVVYAVISAVEIAALMLAGMDLFDAVCHTFTTMATGGFSTRNASIAAYDSAAIDWIIVFFMFLAGTNFALHYRGWRAPAAYFRDQEWRLYALLALGATFIIGTALWSDRAYDFGAALRSASFQVVSIMTTTGFATDDYEQWAPALRWIVFILMLIGGCAGSTAGSMKVVRHLILAKAGLRGTRGRREPARGASGQPGARAPRRSGDGAARAGLRDPLHGRAGRGNAGAVDLRAGPGDGALRAGDLPLQRRSGAGDAGPDGELRLARVVGEVDPDVPHARRAPGAVHGARPLPPADLEALMGDLALPLACLLLCSGLFSGSETALFSIPLHRLRRMAKSSRADERAVARAMDQPRSTLVTILIGNMVVNILASALASAAVLGVAGNSGWALLGVTVVMTFLLLVVGEIAPKTVAYHHSETIARIVARPLTWFGRLLTPVRAPLLWITDRVLGDESAGDRRVELEEAETMVRLAHEEGEVDDEERDLLRGVIELGVSPLEDVMTPRTEIFSLPGDLPVREARERIRQAEFSKVPVSTQAPDEMAGYVTALDLLLAPDDDWLGAHAHPADYVPEVKPAVDLLEEFRQSGRRLAFIVDEHGHLVGMVTLTDLLGGDLRRDDRARRSSQGALRVDSDRTACRFPAAWRSGSSTSSSERPSPPRRARRWPGCCWSARDGSRPPANGWRWTGCACTC